MCQNREDGMKKSLENNFTLDSSLNEKKINFIPNIAFKGKFLSNRNNETRITLNLSIAIRPVNFLIDTGANLTLVSENVLKTPGDEMFILWNQWYDPRIDHKRFNIWIHSH